jgi:hypothetical protein
MKHCLGFGMKRLSLNCGTSLAFEYEGGGGGTMKTLIQDRNVTSHLLWTLGL